MFNLEKLDLDLVICCKNAFIDGNSLKKNIINHMPKLNKFTFNIRSTVRLDNQINLLSNDISTGSKFFISCSPNKKYTIQKSAKN
jgi:hypothetical protein